MTPVVFRTFVSAVALLAAGCATVGVPPGEPEVPAPPRAPASEATPALRSHGTDSVLAHKPAPRVAWSGPPIVTFKTEECTVTDAERRWIERAAADLDLVYQGSIPMPGRHGPVPVIVFCDRADFKNYGARTTREYTPGTGYYDRKRHEVVIYKGPRWLITAIHEINHALVHAAIPNVPKWLTEGLSELVERYDPRDPGLVRPQLPMAQRIEEWIAVGYWAYLEDMLQWKSRVWKSNDRRPDFRSRTLSWGLVYHLMSTVEGRNLLRRILNESQRGGKPTRLLLKYHPGGIEGLQKAFNNTFRRGPPAPFRLD